MPFIDLSLLVVSSGVLIYLLYALIYPERF